MCFSKNAILASIYWLLIHLFIYGVVLQHESPFSTNTIFCCTPKTNFTKEIRPYVIWYLLAFLQMEMFDYALWISHESSSSIEENEKINYECYGNVNLAGQCTVVGTIYSIIILIKRGKINDGIDMKLWYLNVVLFILHILYDSSSTGIQNSILKEIPNTSTGNTWWTDSSTFLIYHVPFYILPVLISLKDHIMSKKNKQIIQDRYEVVSFHLAIYTVVAFLIALILYITWGSVWCLYGSLAILIIDIHVFLEEMFYRVSDSNNYDIHHLS